MRRGHREREGYAVDQIYMGERVCGNRNNYEIGARNGELGVVTSELMLQTEQRTIFQVRFANNPKLPYYSWPKPYLKKERRRFGPHRDLDWAYCLTGNKCQGSEWDHMIVRLTGQ